VRWRCGWIELSRLIELGDVIGIEFQVNQEWPGSSGDYLRKIVQIGTIADGVSLAAESLRYGRQVRQV
jgi:hypothetical protein